MFLLDCDNLTFLKMKFRFTGPNLILEFIFQIFLNKNWKIYWSEQSLIGSYIRSWERPGDLPWGIEIWCLFASGAHRNEQKETKISITSGRSLGLSQQHM
jgi:hypothetical protein